MLMDSLTKGQTGRELKYLESYAYHIRQLVALGVLTDVLYLSERITNTTGLNGRIINIISNDLGMIDWEGSNSVTIIAQPETQTRLASLLKEYGFKVKGLQ